MEINSNIKPCEEAKVAAKWWADQLRHGAKMQSVSDDECRADPNAGFADLLAQLTADKAQNLDLEQIETFELLLAQLIQTTMRQANHWDPSEPMLGSARRVISVDYGACDELRSCYQAAGGQIRVNVFPIKTAMWINPGEVSVRCGYGNEEVVIYQQESEEES